MKEKLLLIFLISIVILPIYDGEMLNCYPERELISNIELLKEIKNLVN